jgi:hypothetical protein
MTDRIRKDQHQQDRQDYCGQYHQDIPGSTESRGQTFLNRTTKRTDEIRFWESRDQTREIIRRTEKIGQDKQEKSTRSNQQDRQDLREPTALAGLQRKDKEDIQYMSKQDRDDIQGNCVTRWPTGLYNIHVQVDRHDTGTEDRRGFRGKEGQLYRTTQTELYLTKRTDGTIAIFYKYHNCICKFFWWLFAIKHSIQIL